MLFAGGARANAVFVDGFNPYFGAVKGTPFKWLDPVPLSRLLLSPGYTIDKLLRFIALVSGTSDLGAPMKVRRTKTPQPT